MHRLNVDKLIRSTCIYRYFDCEIKYWYLEYLKGILHILNHPFTAYTSFKDHPDFTFANLVVFYINCASCNCSCCLKIVTLMGLTRRKEIQEWSGDTDAISKIASLRTCMQYWFRKISGLRQGVYWCKNYVVRDSFLYNSF